MATADARVPRDGASQEFRNVQPLPLHQAGQAGEDWYHKVDPGGMLY